MCRLLAFGSLLLLLAVPAARAEIYRWVDEQGNVHYGDRPAGQDAEGVEVDAGPRRDPEAERRRARRRKLLEAMEEEQEIERRQQEQAQAERKERERRCRIARNRLDSYRRANVIYGYDESGNRRYLNDSERERAIAEARQAVEHWCR
ncbi:MAG: DUF4124 domain-containing protein [Gammaproteobacteria bacterium]|nr:DUF4124 domain-containing protein [Gammaproteobacteria bacterium]NIV20900.1 DUF4124 domain-containing protein [Gammaproteobacteria bacterium]NIY32476.1 DUF4124 domain-containing protein [Gammaproteobacteria bacterium]